MQALIVGARRQGLIVSADSSRQKGQIVAVGDADVVDRWRIAIDGVDDRLQRGAFAHRVGGQIAQLLLIVGIDLLVLQSGLEGQLQGIANLLRAQQVGIVRLLHHGPQQLAHVDQRENRSHQKHQPGNRQNEFGLKSHSQKPPLSRCASYSFSLLWSVFRLMPSVSAALVLF